MWPCERLKSGGLDQTTTGSPIYDAFTSAGVAQTYSPKFMYHGFRYLAVNTTSAPAVADAMGLVIRTDAESVGPFETSDDMLNSIHKITDRAIQSNIYSVMTDCSHREKLGWLEQTHLVFQPVTRNYDCLALGNGIVSTMLDAQIDNGLVPDIAPEFVVFEQGFREDPNWGNALVLMPLMLFKKPFRSQASNAIALGMGVVPAEQESAVAQAIAESIIENGNHLTVGEIALPP
ncbi:hypothetical protein LQW54_006460 [Pestalotiopsis sp. IQ-011]